MPNLDVSELNVVLAVLGSFIIFYGFISVKIKQAWYLGEALPAVLVGIALGPIAASFLSVDRWIDSISEHRNAITLLVIAGFQLPAKYQRQRWAEMLLLLFVVMTIMWLCTTACIMLAIPNLSFLAALVIGSCVTCTDPILSQAVAKGPFSDKFVPRALREIISSEAGANDGFGFPFLLLATFLIRHAKLSDSESVGSDTEDLVARAVPEVGRLGGGVGKAMEQWFVEGWLYIVLMSIVYGVVLGYGSCICVKFALRKKWIDTESYLLWPTALGLFLIGTCGALGTDDLLACFVAGNALNWNGDYLAETEARHDEVNSVVDVLLNFGGFMYIGTIIPWTDFQMPDTTGITVPRLIGLGFLVLAFRRIPAIFLTYRLMPKVVKNWKEALFMGYFGPIGIGAVFYVEHARHLFPEFGEGDNEENNLTAAMIPVVYFLVIFSIIIHGLSIPGLDAFYRWRGVEPIKEGLGVEVRLLSYNEALPANSERHPRRSSIVVHNRFSRPDWSQSLDLEARPSSKPAPTDSSSDDVPLKPQPARTPQIVWSNEPFRTDDDV